MVKVVKGVNDLQSQSPEIAAEWHPTKNGDVKPDEVAYRTAKKYWWLGKCGHEWEAVVSSRTKTAGAGCPYCSGRIPIKGENDLETLRPDIAAQWHPTKNGDLKPSDVTLHSGRKIWWQCKYGHEWKTTGAARVSGSGCPHCRCRQKSSFPEKAIFFYVSKAFPDAVQNYRPMNDKLGNQEFDVWIPSTNTAIEYDGEHWHQKRDRDERKDLDCFENGITLIRVREPGCVSYQSALMPVVIRETNNGHDSLTKAISEVMSIIGKEVDVDTKRDEDAIFELMSDAHLENSVARKFPEVAKEWHPTKNGDLTPDMFSGGSTKKAWWLCEECGNEWKTSICVRCIDGCGCPECAGKKISKSLSTPKPGRSLAELRPDVAKLWHPTKNGPLTPYDVTKSSKNKVWWVCPECGTEWEQAVANRSEAKEQLCQKCSIQAQKGKPKPGQSLGDLFPDIAKEWMQDKNGNKTPFDMTSHSNYKAWWKCSRCGKEWQTTIAARTRHGFSHCPECNRSINKYKATTGVNDLVTKSPELAAEWNAEKNGVPPEKVAYKSCHKGWWKCRTCGEEWQASPMYRQEQPVCPACMKKIVSDRLSKPAPGKSLADTKPRIAALLHPTKNDVKADEIAENSNAKFWFRCEKGHEWTSNPNGMRNDMKSPCPVCGNRQLLVGFNDLKTVRPDVAAEWDWEKNDDSPSDVIYNACVRRWWKCSECGREWDSLVRDRAVFDHGCRSCGQRRRHERERLDK